MKKKDFFRVTYRIIEIAHILWTVIELFL